jgi:hypothetical protein
LIIVEGPDGAGKSTLVSRIEVDWNLTRVPKAVTSTAESLFPIGKYIEDELAKGFSMRVYDRFALISSPRYLMFENRTFVDPMTNPDWLKIQHHRLSRIDPVIIYCLPPLDTVVKNLMREDNSGGKALKNIEEIYYGYLDFYARDAYNTSTMVWDYTNPDLVHVAKLLRWAEFRWKEREGID